MSVIKSLSSAVTSQRKQVSERELIRRESEIGSQLFGSVPSGHRREFFCLDAHTWIWHEEWKEPNGKMKSVTTRYEISLRGVLKVQEGRQYQNVTGQEAQTFLAAVARYYQLVSKHVYGVAV